MKKPSKDQTAGGIHESLRLATAAAQLAKKEAASAETKLDIAKARFKQAKKELRRSKKLSRKTAKRARVAQEELEAWIDQVAQQSPPKKPTRPKSARKKPVTKALPKPSQHGLSPRPRTKVGGKATAPDAGRQAPLTTPELHSNVLAEPQAQAGATPATNDRQMPV